MTLFYNYEKIKPFLTQFSNSKDSACTLDDSSMTLYEIDCGLNDILTESDYIIEHSKKSLRLDWESIEAWQQNHEWLKTEIRKTKARIDSETCLTSTDSAKRHRKNKYFGKEMDGFSDILTGRFAGFVTQFERLATNFEDRHQEIINLYENPNPEELVALHQKGCENWCEKEEDKVILDSFIEGLPSTPNEEQIRKEKRALFENFKGNPLVKNHHRYHSNIKMLAVKQRQVHASVEDFDDYFEYVNKLRILNEYRQQKPRATLSNIIFTSEYNRHPQRLHELRDWLEPLLSSKANELFIPYYVLWSLNQVKNTKIPKFVEQLSQWFPEKYPNGKEQLEKLSNSIYTEMEHWKIDGNLIPFSDLHDKLPLLKIREKKRERFHTAISNAYGLLNPIIKEWKTR